MSEGGFSYYSLDFQRDRNLRATPMYVEKTNGLKALIKYIRNSKLPWRRKCVFASNIATFFINQKFWWYLDSVLPKHESDPAILILDTHKTIQTVLDRWEFLRQSIGSLIVWDNHGCGENNGRPPGHSPVAVC